MSCCSSGGGCSCGKGSKAQAPEQVYLVQNSSNEISSFLSGGFGNVRLDADIVEVRFENNRRDYFRNSRLLELEKDERVVVDYKEGQQVGTVTQVGALAEKQLEKKNYAIKKSNLKHVLRIANTDDINNWLKNRIEKSAAQLGIRKGGDQTKAA